MTQTTNYNFTKLSGTDIAGYSSINVVIDSIDQQLDTHFSSMILVWPGASAPAGWQAYTPPTGSMPALPVNHIWIQKT
jgi:hypothetical protein